ncbi:MAG: hypothetical protein ACN6O7_01945 [Sphingobacterium sp.]
MPGSIYFVQLLRIIKSLELPGTKQFTISQIAYKVGYKSVQAFTNSFLYRDEYTTSNFMVG